MATETDLYTLIEVVGHESLDSLDLQSNIIVECIGQSFYGEHHKPPGIWYKYRIIERTSSKKAAEIMVDDIIDELEKTGYKVGETTDKYVMLDDDFGCRFINCDAGIFIIDVNDESYFSFVSDLSSLEFEQAEELEHKLKQQDLYLELKLLKK